MALLGATFIMNSCTKRSFDVQGHRGCRGYFPENSLEGFEYAMGLGVTTLELDVVISADQKVVVSHEPWLNGVICLDPEGKTIDPASGEHNLYNMSYEEIGQCDCGSLGNPRFPEQRRIKTQKPLLSDVFRLVSDFSEAKGSPAVFFNVETKIHPEGDSVYHPDPKTFVDLLMSEVNRYELSEVVTIQSFDVRTLQYAKEAYPRIRLALLVEEGRYEQNPFDESLKTLGFMPDIYSCDYHLLSEPEVRRIQGKGVSVIPWTVNDPEEIEKLIRWGVDGIISDYPDRVIDRL